jgi:hypothetical protein
MGNAVSLLKMNDQFDRAYFSLPADVKTKTIICGGSCPVSKEICLKLYERKVDVIITLMLESIAAGKRIINHVPTDHHSATNWTDSDLDDSNLSRFTWVSNFFKVELC